MGLFDRLGKRKETPALEQRLAELDSPDARVRRAAAVALGDLGALAEGAQSALEERLADEDGEVCLAVSDALSRIRKALHR